MIPTIFALSSGSLPCAIAVFRVSGPKSLPILRELSGKSIWKPRVIRYTKLSNRNGIIDEAMAVYMPGPKTFTGEDTAELFVHGSRAVAAELANTLNSFENVREAKRGEFTRRAFHNGKMSINEVRALDRLIKSRSEKERRMAFGQMRGGTKALEIREKLGEIIAQLFVIMDFGEHVEMRLQDTRNSIIEINSDVRKLMKNWESAQIADRGLNFVLYGRPNSGKSSILNRLAHDDVAIVSPIAGTTRDSIEISIEISGIRCNITDTAGIRRESVDPIEIEGMNRARKRISAADIILVVIDPFTVQNELDEFLEEIQKTANPESRIVVVRNKIDLKLPYPEIEKFGGKSNRKISLVDTIAIDENGLATLRSSLDDIVDEICPEATFLLDSTILEKCEAHLILAEKSTDAAIMCSHVESTMREISELSSNLVSEQVLDTIFSGFCIGK